MSQPLFLFAPGAGAPSTSEWMKAWAKRLRTLGKVVRFDYPYMKAGRASPDRPEVLMEAHAAALKKARARHRGPVFLAGKSMGGRIGCHVSLEQEVNGLICFGYPLRSPAGKLRDQVLLALKTPVLFLQGTKDPLCPLALLEPIRSQMTARSVLHVTEGGDHSLIVGSRALKERGQTQAQLNDELLAAVRAFVTPAPPAKKRRRTVGSPQGQEAHAIARHPSRFMMGLNTASAADRDRRRKP